MFGVKRLSIITLYDKQGRLAKSDFQWQGGGGVIKKSEIWWKWGEGVKTPPEKLDINKHYLWKTLENLHEDFLNHNFSTTSLYQTIMDFDHEKKTEL